jgi:RNA-directed DNA polymerase
MTCVNPGDPTSLTGNRSGRYQWGTDRRPGLHLPFRQGRQDGPSQGQGADRTTDHQQEPRDGIRLLRQTLRGWTNYYRHGASKITFSELEHYLWHRVWKWLRRKHHRRHWRWITRTYASPHNRWGFTAGGRELFNPAKVSIQRYRYRGNTIPTPWSTPTSLPTVQT